MKKLSNLTIFSLFILMVLFINIPLAYATHDTSSFAAAVDYAVGDDPNFPTVSDFNNDDIADIVVTNYDTNNVSVLLGVGDGTFGAKIDTPTVEPNPYNLIVADFNNDTFMDLVAMNSTDKISVLIGNGDGTFDAAVSYTAGTFLYTFMFGNFNADNYKDLAIVNSGSNNVSILLNNGDGTFAAAVNYTVGGSPIGITGTDLNNDTFVDLVTSNFTTDNISVLIGNGDGTFDAKVDYAAGTGLGKVSATDFNGDTFVDLAKTNFTTNNVSVFLGNGDGTLDAAVNYAVGTGPNSEPFSDDFDNDGVPDLAVGNTTSGNISILLGVGDGTFGAKVDYAIGGVPSSVFILGVDLNNDGFEDLATANDATSKIVVLLGNDNGTFDAAVNYNAGAGVYELVSGDFNGDNKLDLATTPTPSVVQVFLNTLSLPSVSFPTASSTDVETNLAPSIPVELSVANDVDVTVDYTVTGTASGSGVDYTLANGTLTIPMGDTTANIPLTIVNDTEVETPETVILTLSNPLNSLLGATDVFTYTITDNDYTLTYTAGANGTISGTTPQTVNEGTDGTAVTAVPADGYYFVDWSDASTANPRTDTNVLTNISVTANFSRNPPTSGSRPNKTTTTIITPSNTVTVSTACPVGHLFSTSTGLPCKTFFTPSNNTCVITQTLRQGDKGDQVKCLQTGLKILNDGIFGPMTKASVIAFQKLHNLVPDGIFGPKSLAQWGR